MLYTTQHKQTTVQARQKRNIWQTKRVFEFPSVPNLAFTTADFNHLEQLVIEEHSRPLKIAFQLNSRLLKANDIEKCSTKPMNAVFNERTIKALRHYSTQHGKPWLETAAFIEHFTNCMKILSVKHQEMGKWKRDKYRDPIRAEPIEPDWKLQHLRDMAIFVGDWWKSGKPGLTKETAFAYKQMCTVLPALADFLLKECDFKYVLLGKLTSDPLEARFGQYRQMAGGNYYIAMRQRAGSERKMQTVELLKIAG